MQRMKNHAGIVFMTFLLTLAVYPGEVSAPHAAGLLPLLSLLPLLPLLPLLRLTWGAQ
jgi:hypothetical protein